MANVRPRVFLNGQDQQIQDGDTLQIPDLRLANKRVTISSSQPSTPRTIGDQWLEVDSNGLPLYGWWWHWVGQYWRSPDQLWSFNFEAGLTVATSRYLKARTTLNYFFKSYQVGCFINSPNTATSFWNHELRAASGTLNVTVGTGSNTQTASTANWVNLPIQTLNQRFIQISGPVAIFNFAFIPQNNPGSLVGAVELIYQFERP